MPGLLDAAVHKKHKTNVPRDAAERSLPVGFTADEVRGHEDTDQALIGRDSCIQRLRTRLDYGVNSSGSRQLWHARNDQVESRDCTRSRWECIACMQKFRTFAEAYIYTEERHANPCSCTKA